MTLHTATSTLVHPARPTLSVETIVRPLAIEMGGTHHIIPDPVAYGEPRIPHRFVWRGRRYVVRSIMGHWREDAIVWTSVGVAIPQADLYRLAAQPEDSPPDQASTMVCELLYRQDQWEMHYVWD